MNMQWLYSLLHELPRFNFRFEQQPHVVLQPTWHQYLEVGTWAFTQPQKPVFIRIACMKTEECMEESKSPFLQALLWWSACIGVVGCVLLLVIAVVWIVHCCQTHKPAAKRVARVRKLSAALFILSVCCLFVLTIAHPTIDETLTVLAAYSLASASSATSR